MNTVLKSDVVVVGASLAGAAAAFLLGRAGLGVALVDPQSFPRRKPCGEGLAAPGRDCLEALGLWSSELTAAAQPYYGYSINFVGGRRLVLGGGSRRPPLGFGISRGVLDAHVWEAAASLPSVTLLQEQAAAPQRSADGWTVETSGGRQLRSKAVVLACGGRAAKLLPELKLKRAPLTRCGMAFWCTGRWKHDTLQMVRIFNRPEGQYIVTPLPDGEVNFSILLSQPSAHDLSKSAIQSRALGILQAAGYSVGSFSKLRGAAGIESARLIEPSRSIYVVGDAVERFDPIGGAGMNHALFSAVLAAKAVLTAGESASAGCVGYYRQHARAVRSLRLLTRLSGLLNKPGGGLPLQLARFAPGLTLRGMLLLRSCPGAVKAAAKFRRGCLTDHGGWARPASASTQEC